MKKVLDRIIALLEADEKLRDSLNKTLRAIWDEDLKKQETSLSSMLGSTLMDFLEQGKITKFETVRRMWQLAQQRHPHLRGENYDERHGKSEPETKQEIKDLNKIITQEKKEEKLEAVIEEGNPQTQLHL